MRAVLLRALEISIFALGFFAILTFKLHLSVFKRFEAFGGWALMLAFILLLTRLAILAFGD